MYSTINYPTKVAMKRAIAANGHAGTVYQPGGIVTPPTDGIVTLEGPHYPKPHTWYARVQLKGGVIVKVVS